MTCYRAPGAEIEQSLILRDVELYFVVLNGEADVEATPYVTKYIVVLTQECDLRFDRLARRGEPLSEGGQPIPKDKVLNGVMVCPAYPLDEVLAGVYIEGAQPWKGTREAILTANREERYHVLPAAEGVLTQKLALDFKLAFTVSAAYLEAWRRSHPDSALAALLPPWRDRLVQRYVQYFGRIAEPDDV